MFILPHHLREVSSLLVLLVGAGWTYAASPDSSIVSGSLVGSVVLAMGDYTGLGPIAGLISLASAVVYIAAVDETRLGAAGEQAPARPPVKAGV